MKNYNIIFVFCALFIVFVTLPGARALENPVFFGDTTYPVRQNTLILDSNNSGGDISLQFGDLLNKAITWNASGGTGSGLFNINATAIIGGRLGIGNTYPISTLHVTEDNSATSSGAGLTIENQGSGDSLIQLLLTGIQRWIIGIDNSDQDKLKIASSMDLASDTYLTITTTGSVGIGTETPHAQLDIHPTSPHALNINPYGSVAGNTGQLEFSELAAGGTNYVGLKAPNSITNSTIWTLPGADGSNGQVLSTNGAGTLSWAAGSSLPSSSTDNSTLRYDSLAASWQNNPNFQATSSGDLILNDYIYFNNGSSEYIHWINSGSGFELSNHLIPSADNNYSLGTPTRRWNYIYISENLTLGDGDINVGAGGMTTTFANTQAGVGNTITIGDLLKLDTASSNSVILTTSQTDSPIGVAANDSANGENALVLMIGRATLKCIDGVIGDSMQTSSTNGYAKSGGSSTKIVGHATSDCVGNTMTAAIHLE